MARRPDRLASRSRAERAAPCPAPAARARQLARFTPRRASQPRCCSASAPPVRRAEAQRRRRAKRNAARGSMEERWGKGRTRAETNRQASIEIRRSPAAAMRPARVAIAQTRRGPLALAALMTGARVHRRGSTPLTGDRTALLAQGSATLRTRTCPPPQRRSGGRLARPRDRRAAGAGAGTAAAAAGRGARPLSLSPIRSRLQPPSTRPPPVCARGLNSSLA